MHPTYRGAEVSKTAAPLVGSLATWPIGLRSRQHQREPALCRRKWPVDGHADRGQSLLRRRKTRYPRLWKVSSWRPDSDTRQVRVTWQQCQPANGCHWRHTSGTRRCCSSTRLLPFLACLRPFPRLTCLHLLRGLVRDLEHEGAASALRELPSLGCCSLSSGSNAHGWGLEGHRLVAAWRVILGCRPPVFVLLQGCHC